MFDPYALEPSVPDQLRTCDVCDGDGYIVYSCCGDDIKDTINESDICPSCGEHCGDEKEDCEECNKGEIK